MSYNWGPHYIVPSEALKNYCYSGGVRLREDFDEELLRKELEEFGLRLYDNFINIALVAKVSRI